MIESMMSTSSTPSTPSTTSIQQVESDCSTTTSSLPDVSNPTTTLSSNKLTIRDYLRLFEHSIECTESAGCGMAKCKTFKRLLGHFKQCARLGQCEYCRWLLQILIVHAKWCEKQQQSPTTPGVVNCCPVPFCHAIKLKINERELFSHRVESIKEFIRSGCDLLMNKYVSSSVQTTTSCHHDGCCSTEDDNKKRKLDDQDLQNTDPPVLDAEEEEEKQAQQRSALLERINQIKREANHVNGVPVVVVDQFEKEIRQAIVKFLVESSQERCLIIDYEKDRFVQVAAYAMKRERSLFASSSSTHDYLYLMTDLLYQMQSEIDKMKRTAKKSVVTETATQTDDVDLEEESDDASSSKKKKKLKLAE